MTLLVRDEEDIIKENIDFHYSQGVDFFIVTDNKSVDSTASILKEYINKGIVHYIFEPDDNYNQSAWVTRMAQMAYTKYNADWVINNDADEFWFPTNDNNLKQHFEKISSSFNVLMLKRINFVPTDIEGSTFYEKMIYKESKSLNSAGTPILPKVAHRGDPNIVVGQGNHMVSNINVNLTKNPSIEIFHFPIRERNQFCNKIIKGGSAYERNTEMPKEVGSSWRKLYKEYTKEKNLNNYLNESIFNNKQIKEALSTGYLIEDKRLYNYLDAFYN